MHNIQRKQKVKQIFFILNFLNLKRKEKKKILICFLRDQQNRTRKVLTFLNVFFIEYYFFCKKK